jgi:hypothetical protein
MSWCMIWPSFTHQLHLSPSYSLYSSQNAFLSNIAVFFLAMRSLHMLFSLHRTHFSALSTLLTHLYFFREKLNSNYSTNKTSWVLKTRTQDSSHWLNVNPKLTISCLDLRCQLYPMRKSCHPSGSSYTYYYYLPHGTNCNSNLITLCDSCLVFWLLYFIYHKLHEDTLLSFREWIPSAYPNASHRADPQNVSQMESKNYLKFHTL